MGKHAQAKHAGTYKTTQEQEAQRQSQYMLQYPGDFSRHGHDLTITERTRIAADRAAFLFGPWF